MPARISPYKSASSNHPGIALKFLLTCLFFSLSSLSPILAQSATAAAQAPPPTPANPQALKKSATAPQQADLKLPAFPEKLTRWAAVGTARNPVFQGRGGDHWDAKIRERGWIVRNGDQWRLYYTGYNTSKSAKTDLRMLGLATSTDGLHWQRHGDQPLIDDQWVEDMSILQHNGQWIMVAEGRDDVAHSFVSKDGLKWHREGPLDIRTRNGSPIAAGPRGTPFLMIENDKWYLFYERADAGIWLASSSDRKSWVNLQDEPVIALGPEKYDLGGIALNQIIKIDGIYYAVLHANETRPFNPYWTTTLAQSKDLIHWQKYAGNPVVSNNSSSGQLIPLQNGNWQLFTMHPEVRVFEFKAGSGK